MERFFFLDELYSQCDLDEPQNILSVILRAICHGAEYDHHLEFK